MRNNLTAPALLDPQRGDLVVALSKVDVGDLLLVLRADTEQLLAAEGEVAVLALAEAGQVGLLGGGTGVRDGQGDGLNGILNDVEVLPGSRGRAPAGVGGLAAVAGVEDEDLVLVGVGADESVS